MKRLSSTFVFATLLLLAAFAQSAPIVTLITIGPGDASYEKFGHVALRIDDEDRHFDAAYNWGLFDFEAPNFIGNFILGRMTYSMGAFEPHSMMLEYLHQDRRVRMQVLKLSPAEAETLLMACENNRLPQNASYQYDYFRDNCSSRVRDIIDQATGGRITRDCLPLIKPMGLSYRQQMLRLMGDDFWLSFGIDFCLGPSTDKPLMPWEECFLPMRLADVVAPMADEQPAPWPSKRPPEPTVVPNRAPYTAAIGVLGGVLMIAALRWKRCAGRFVAGLWWLISGFGGCFLIYAWTTDHWAAHANQNMLYFSPLAILALALPVQRRKWWVAGVAVVAVIVTIAGYIGHAANILPDVAGAIAAVAMAIDLVAIPTLIAVLLPIPHRHQAGTGVAAAIAIISVVALLLKLAGPLSQGNAAFIALALPLNLAALYVWSRPRLTPAPAAIELATP